jgi:hypothetical protein
MPPPLPLKLKSAKVMVIYDGVTLEFNRRPTEEEAAALAHNIEVWLDNEAGYNRSPKKPPPNQPP